MLRFSLAACVTLLSLFSQGISKNEADISGLLQHAIDEDILQRDIEETLTRLGEVDNAETSESERDVLMEYLRAFVDAERVKFPAKFRRLWGDNNTPENRGTDSTTTTTTTSTTPPTSTTTASTTTTTTAATTTTTEVVMEAPFPPWHWPPWIPHCLFWCRKRSSNTNRHLQTVEKLKMLNYLLNNELD